MLTPLLRIAVGLEAGRTQKVSEIETSIDANAVTVTVRTGDDSDLELWAAERATDSFRQVYGVPMGIARQRK